jgi:abequosyltransferase
MDNKLLSICIPTFNRCDTLDNTLYNLFSNPEFDDNLIEVIVSDNCSTDDTAFVVSRYTSVRYFKNIENVRDCNFSIVLSLAKGSYIRLFNDTLTFKKGVLKKMLDKIKKHSFEKCNLFFYNNMFLNNDCVLFLENREKFIKKVSYYPTWIANFGCWREDFYKINNKDRYAELQFVQVDWSYRIVENSKKTIIYFDDLFNVATPNKKGGYNVFNTFVNNYLYIIKQERLPLFAYEKEKYRLYKHFVYPWLVTLLITDNEKYNYDLKGVHKIIFKKYWYTFYFYFFQLIFILRKFKK